MLSHSYLTWVWLCGGGRAHFALQALTDAVRSTLTPVRIVPMRWPPFQHVFFDCDSTLTAVEGIDVLAAQAGRAEEIAGLTAAAMDGRVDLEKVYAERLAAVEPTRSEIAALRQTYKDNVVPDAGAVLATLMSLGIDVYIVSGGLLEPMREFGISLGVPGSNIRAVGIQYDQLARMEAGTRWPGE